MQSRTVTTISVRCTHTFRFSGIAARTTSSFIVSCASYGALQARSSSVALSTLCTSLALLVVAGTLAPGIPAVGAIGTVIYSAVSLHLLLLGGAGLLCAGWALRLGGRRFVTVLAAVALAATVGAAVPLVPIVRAAHSYGASIDWLEHARVTGPTFAGTVETVAFARLGETELKMDVYRPSARVGAQKSAPVFMMHPGSYVAGNRSQARNWDVWLAGQGYTVFDVDYRLAPPPTWNTAARDVACAMAWVRERADRYGVDTSRTIVMGQSAGGGLALQVAYARDGTTVTSSCGGDVPAPKAVVAIYPAADLLLAWSATGGLGPLTGRQLAMDYVGGSPTDYPDRYRTASPASHVGAGSPPTLVAFGEQDHLLPASGQRQLADRLTRAGVANVIVAFPTWTTPTTWRGAAWAPRSPDTRSRPSCDASCRRFRTALTRATASSRVATVATVWPSSFFGTGYEPHFNR